MKYSFPNFGGIGRWACVVAVTIIFGGGIARASVALEWNEALEHAVGDLSARMPSFLEARTFALAHLAMVEAGASARGNARSFADPARAEAVAVSAAACTVLVELLPPGGTRFAELHRRELESAASGGDQLRAERMGREAAAVVLQQRANDGWQALAASSSAPGLAPDDSLQHADTVASGTAPRTSPWLSTKPFLLKNAGQFEAVPPSYLAPDGATRINYQVTDPRFFNSVDRSGPADALPRAWRGDAIVTWNRLARAALTSAPKNLADEVRLLAVLNAAMADAVIAAQHARFTLGSWHSTTVEVWEPADTGERATDVIALVDGGPNSMALRNHNERVLIPPLPNYPSIASAVAGAAQAALAAGFKTDHVAVTLPGPAAGENALRTFTSFSLAARECVFVAMLDGHHTREACLAGHDLGTAVGRYVARRGLGRK